MEDFKIIYSNRKTLSLSVTHDFEIVVRAPKGTRREYIDRFVISNINWIDTQLAKIKFYNENRIILTDEQKIKLKHDAKLIIGSRLAYFEDVMGLKATSFKITSAEHRYGSCSGKNGLCFAYKTALLPIDLIDYVVVHELAHIIEKNHSRDFYAVVEKYLPDYKQRVAKIKELGRLI